jgi:hypothetical protein
MFTAAPPTCATRGPARRQLRTRSLAACLALALGAAACGDGRLHEPPRDAPRFLETAQHVGRLTATTAAAIVGQLGLGGVFQPHVDVDFYTIRYHTVGIDGSATLASGAVWIPAGGGPHPTALYLHGTTLPRTNVPSSPGSEEGSAVGLLFGTDGFMVVMPDYLGMGAAAAVGFHPWQHAESAASAARDMLRAARELASLHDVALDTELFIFGYSQGGHAAMAVHRELEREAAAEFPITASAPLAGSYDMSGTARIFLDADPAHGPVVFYTAYLVAVYNEIYGFAPSLSDVLLPEYAAVAADILAGEQGLHAIMPRLPDRPRTLFQQAFLAAIEADAEHAFWRALRDNDVYDWAPLAPLRLFHASGDRDVPFANAVVAAAHMRQRGAAVEVVDLGSGLSHAAAVVPAFTAAKQWFDAFR